MIDVLSTSISTHLMPAAELLHSLASPEASSDSKASDLQLCSLNRNQHKESLQGATSGNVSHTVAHEKRPVVIHYFVDKCLIELFRGRLLPVLFFLNPFSIPHFLRLLTWPQQVEVFNVHGLWSACCVCNYVLRWSDSWVQAGCTNTSTSPDSSCQLSERLIGTMMELFTERQYCVQLTRLSKFS